MKRQKGFDWYKFVTISMVVIGVGFFLISLILPKHVWRDENPGLNRVKENQETAQILGSQSLNTPSHHESRNRLPDKPEEARQIDEVIVRENSAKFDDGKFDDERQLDSKEKMTAESNPTSKQQHLQELADAAIAEIPVLVDEWKEVMAKRHALNGVPNTEARAQEFNRLTNRRTEIERRILQLAFTYHGIRPEERAIFSNGEIGRLAKEVGLVFTDSPFSP